uniref:S-layer protein SslA n=1 Tax=Sporosarcina ureae TaxID=1571 RepID=Q0VJW4_SPOUR|nr:S-layer protein SslA [Sporosarcina ureae]
MANQPTKYRKFVVGAASAALVASAVAPVAFAAEFTDVKDNNSHKAAIDALSDAGVISGYPDGTFQPNKTLTRSDVVKLMGKWLVSEGYKVPTDYKTKPRFSDLKTTSNDELLKMSALVYDNGVFVGKPDGSLDANGDITRENIAIVLVRAFDRVYDVDLVSYVKAQEFKKDVTDLGKAKAEARPAIDVLDFFDITNPAAPEFNPKSTTTRGQFASFLYKTTKVDFDEVGGGIVAPGVASVKGINATTVEVTMKDKVSNIDSLKFTIDGLTVSNAAVKQTDDKTIVLTTATQKGGEKYTVKLDGKEIGSFTGIEAVVPTTLKITNASVQGKTGQQAILSADTGVKKAGIPVTFNVKADTLNTTNKDQVFEVMTNEDGLHILLHAYSAGKDEVTAYPTGAPTVRDQGFVFWGVDTILNIEDVTVGNTIANGANKTYKITYKDAKTGKVEANKTFNVSLAENINVTSDKLSNATVNGVKVSQLVNDKAPKTATVTTDSEGEATFTVSGTNTTATPVVFGLNPSNGKAAATYESNLLQAKASTVTFSAQQAEYAIELTRDGGDIAAKDVSNGRKYNVVVKNKEGNIAKNEIINVAFNEDLDRVISTNTQAYFIKVNDDKTQTKLGKQVSVKTDSEGKASFVIGSDVENDYATPIAWIDVNTPNAVEGRLDQGEPLTIGSISYFKDAYLDGAQLKVYKGNKETSSFQGNETATFKASLVNQSNKTMPNTSIKTVSYTIFNTGANNVIVDGQTISPNRSFTVTHGAANADLDVKTVDGMSSSVRVLATGTAIDTDGKDYAFTAKEATATFTSVTSVVKEYTGAVGAVNKKTIQFVDKDAITIKDGAKFFGGNGSEIIGIDAFITELESYNSGGIVTYLEDADGKQTFKVVREDTNGQLVNAAKLTEAEITRAKADSVVVTKATANALVISSNPDVIVEGVTYAYDANATDADLRLYKNAADLAEKITNDESHDVTAKIGGAGNLNLTGDAEGENFTYKIGAASAVTTANGVKASQAVKQQITFTFTEAVKANIDDSVNVGPTGAAVAGTVTDVAGTNVVVTLETALNLGSEIDVFDVKGTAVKTKVSEKHVDLTKYTCYKSNF